MGRTIDGEKPGIELGEVLDEVKAADLEGCALRIREMAKHARDNHKCVSSHQVLTAIAARLEWFHERAMKGADLLQDPPVIQ